MKRKRYSEEKIISILKEHDAGASVPDLSRRHGIVENTIYRWKSKYGGMEVSEAKRLRVLESENAKLKKLPSHHRSQTDRVVLHRPPFAIRTNPLRRMLQKWF